MSECDQSLQDITFVPCYGKNSHHSRPRAAFSIQSLKFDRLLARPVLGVLCG